jgi:hypothetical protein
MARYIESAGVQEQGIWFLRVIAGYGKPFCKKIKLAGAEAAFKLALDTHPEHARIKVCVNACTEVFAQFTGGDSSPLQDTPPKTPSAPSERKKSAKKKLFGLFQRS